jgi:hypothetical protein
VSKHPIIVNDGVIGIVVFAPDDVEFVVTGVKRESDCTEFEKVFLGWNSSSMKRDSDMQEEVQD